MDHLSREFKTKSDTIITNLLEKLGKYEGTLPVPIPAIQLAKGFMLDPLDGHARIKMFIEDSHHTWDAVKARDEAQLIEALKEEVAEKAPGSAGMVANIVDFALTNRHDLLGEEFENYLWTEVGDLIKISIEYAWLKREMRRNDEGVLKPTQRFAPKVSLKKNAETWGIELLPY